MGNLNWDDMRKLASSGERLLTKTGFPFQVVSATEDTLTVRVSTGEEYTILRKTLEKAVEKIQAGIILDGPKDYRIQVADERPAYAWAILKHLGLLNEKAAHPGP